MGMKNYCAISRANARHANWLGVWAGLFSGTPIEQSALELAATMVFHHTPVGIGLYKLQLNTVGLCRAVLRRQRLCIATRTRHRIINRTVFCLFFAVTGEN